jgi:hypothetical protein
MKITKIFSAGIVLAMAIGFGYQTFAQNSDHQKHHPAAKEVVENDAGSGTRGTSGMNTCPMGAENCPMMQGGQMGMMHELMHGDKIDLNVTEIDDGIIIKWSSSDKEVAKKLKSMGLKMKTMHPMMKGHMGKALHQGMMDQKNKKKSGK